MIDISMVLQTIREAEIEETRYFSGASLSALDKSVRIREKILNLPGFDVMDDEELRLNIWHDSANVYLRRFQVTGIIEDVNCAISLWEKAIRGVHESNIAYLPSLWNGLATGFLSHYSYTGSLDDLENAIKLLQKATRSDSKSLPDFFNNLGIAKRHRYTHKGDFHDLEEAIESFQKAVELTSPNSPASFLNNLGSALVDRNQR